VDVRKTRFRVVTGGGGRGSLDCSKQKIRLASTHRSDVIDSEVPLPAIPYVLALALVQLEQTDAAEVASLFMPLQKFSAPEKLF
jgi:hypothetical protein